MPLGIIERFGGKVLAWSFALALILALVGLLVATGESLRRQERRSPFTQVVEPDLPLAPADVYHSPGVAAWPTP
jgi:hypothetical protein